MQNTNVKTAVAMGKYHNDVKITSGRRLYVQEPIDDRIVFQGRSDVEADIASEQCLRWYEGMQMVLNDEAEIYIWLPVDNLPQTTAILDYSRYTFRTDFPDPLYAGREFAFVRRTYVQLKHSELTLDDGTNPHGTTKDDVGLGNVDNTPDTLKPVSQPQQTALDGKEPILGKPASDGQYLASTRTGLRYWAASPQSIGDAPADNRIYGRINQLWQEILALKVGYNDSVTGLIQGPSNVQNAIEALVEQINALASGRRFLGIHDSDLFPTNAPTGGYLSGDYYIISNQHNIILPGDIVPTFFGNGDWMVAEENSGIVTWARFVPTKSRQPIEPFDPTKVYPVNSIVSENEILWANFGTTSIQPGAFDPTQWLQLTYSQSTDRPSDFISQQWVIPDTLGDINEWYRVASFDPLGPKFILKLLLFLDEQTVDIEFVGSTTATIGLMNTICSDPGITVNPTIDLDLLLPIRGIGIERVSDTEYYVIVQPVQSPQVTVRAEIYIVNQDMELTNPVEITTTSPVVAPVNQRVIQWIGNVIVGYRGSAGDGLEGYYLPYVKSAPFKPDDRPYAQQRDVVGRYVDKYNTISTDTDISAATNKLDYAYYINPVADMTFTMPFNAADNTRVVLYLFKNDKTISVRPSSTDLFYSMKTNTASGAGVQLLFSNSESIVVEFLYTAANNAWLYNEVSGVSPLDFENGLTESNEVVKLGGELTEDTIINIVNYFLELQSPAGGPNQAKFRIDGGANGTVLSQVNDLIATVVHQVTLLGGAKVLSSVLSGNLISRLQVDANGISMESQTLTLQDVKLYMDDEDILKLDVRPEAGKESIFTIREAAAGNAALQTKYTFDRQGIPKIPTDVTTKSYVDAAGSLYVKKAADFTITEPSGTWLQLTSVQTSVTPPPVPPKEGTYWVIDLPEGHRAVWDAAWGFPGSTISEGRITLQIVRTATGYIKQHFGNPPRFEEKSRDISMSTDEIGTTYYGIGGGSVTAPSSGLVAGQFWYVDISPTATGSYSISTSVPGIGGTALPKGSQWVIRRNINNNGWELLRIGSESGSGGPVGQIIAFPTTTPPTGHLLCDGSTFSATTYPALAAVLGGNRLPDLRFQFIRGSANQSDINGFTKRNDTTRRPRTSNFTTNQQGNHNHDIAVGFVGAYKNAVSETSQVGAISSLDKNWVGGPYEKRMPGSQVLWDGGAHTHDITSGGDNETAPLHVYMAYMIKAL